MITAKELTNSYFLNKNSDFQPLSHIADIVSGIYTHSSHMTGDRSLSRTIINRSSLINNQ